MTGAVRLRADGIDLVVRLTPRAARDAVDGIGEASDGSRHLAARVRAVPEKGAANAALQALIAAWLGVPRGAVAIACGGTARLKTLRISGSPAELAEAVDRRLSGVGGGQKSG